jgi:hypothetical protein
MNLNNQFKKQKFIIKNQFSQMTRKIGQGFS